MFTPTYNRAHTLPRLYRSLLEQTFRKFEWLIIDDGSTDGTRDLVAKWQSEADFPIRYHWQENAGKHIAFNHGASLAKAALLAGIDSDDVALPHTLQAYWSEWNAIDPDQRAHFSGVSGLCIDDQGEVVGTEYPRSPMVSDLSEIRYQWKVEGDKHGCYNTSALLSFPFPDIDGARFVPEGVVWAQIASVYRHRFFNQVVLKKYIHDSAGNQLTKVQDPTRHARGHAYWHREKLNTEMRWFRHAPVQFLRSAVHYVRFSLHDAVSLGSQFKQLSNGWARILWCAALPLGYAVYIRDRRRLRNVRQERVMS